VTPVYEACERHGVLPIIPLRKVKTATPPGPPTCEHGTWTFAGADFKNKRTKWRCPNAGVNHDGQLRIACTPASVWIKADRRNPLVPRHTKRFGDLYRGRGAVEREFGRLKHDYALAPLRVRGVEKVQLHADLCILARLAAALARARSVPLAA
jgi:transposase